MMPVHTGSDRDAAEIRDLVRDSLIASGQERAIITFSGSSEDRAGSRAAAVARAVGLRAPAHIIGCMAVIGGPHRRGRGWRYVCRHEPGVVALLWVNWRRCKRLVRRNAAEIVR